jgi:hypothetical protein
MQGQPYDNEYGRRNPQACEFRIGIGWPHARRAGPCEHRHQYDHGRDVWICPGGRGRDVKHSYSGHAARWLSACLLSGCNILCKYHWADHPSQHPICRHRGHDRHFYWPSFSWGCNSRGDHGHLFDGRCLLHLEETWVYLLYKVFIQGGHQGISRSFPGSPSLSHNHGGGFWAGCLLQRRLLSWQLSMPLF